jgi:hypothetical protein
MSQFKEVDIEELHDDDAFAAWGYVTLKVQRGEEILGVKVKIASVPQEMIDTLRKKAPRPPTKTVMLDPSNPDHAALGATTRQKALIPDFNDAEYRVALEEHDLLFRREIVGRGVASKLKLRDGSPADSPEQKYRALEERGLSGLHFTEIAGQILQLTQWSEEERANFLTKPSAGTRVN